ncbi:hypothetical protein K469DRAFT_692918 [Zopfia rhizophila CBS 207.26]|uniref:Uncharacterized protein n=1 Tax=Zopfia rhizophila CBS 207.26 TaxID=1314779 RepID=A0A6A6DR32_9PEZI|nr:hypothetical protein K469DRAFT_692918 [Zopfia rhizophila CBS 207.26]
MDSFLTSPRSPPPNSASTIGTRRGKTFMPLSSHGMPKSPLPMSPGSVRSHRFDGSLRSPPMSPGNLESPPLSPPMSAKSFGTFIDSEPSTPAYSPRAPSHWDSSTLLLLSPVSTTPSSPPEPQWEMMTPARKPNRQSRSRGPSPNFTSNNITRESSLSSHPVSSSEEKDNRENVPPEPTETKEDPVSDATRQEEEPSHAAPLEKLATRMKSILRRKTVSEKKAPSRRRVRHDLDRMEDVHWTEM